jgi:hypothetical protein
MLQYHDHITLSTIHHSEPAGDKEYGCVEARQKTSRTGYHATEADVRRLCARQFNGCFFLLRATTARGRRV